MSFELSAADLGGLTTILDAIVRKTLTDSSHLKIMPRGRLFPAGTIKQIRYERGVSSRPGGKRS